MATKAKFRFEDLPKDYNSLCENVLMPRKIHDQVEYENATEITDAMVLWRDDFNKDQFDYFDLLCTIIEDYDAQVKWPKVTDPEMLKHLMEEHGMSAADLSRILGGSRNLGSMILRGERNLTVEHIRKLAAHFKVSPAVFIEVWRKG